MHFYMVLKTHEAYDNINPKKVISIFFLLTKMEFCVFFFGKDDKRNISAWREYFERLT